MERLRRQHPEHPHLERQDRRTGVPADRRGRHPREPVRRLPDLALPPHRRHQPDPRRPGGRLEAHHREPAVRRAGDEEHRTRERRVHPLHRRDLRAGRRLVGVRQLHQDLQPTGLLGARREQPAARPGGRHQLRGRGEGSVLRGPAEFQPGAVQGRAGQPGDLGRHRLCRRAGHHHQGRGDGTERRTGTRLATHQRLRLQREHRRGRPPHRRRRAAPQPEGFHHLQDAR
ncbi:hypothetical protein D9M71_469650 [compost metagenome]